MNLPSDFANARPYTGGANWLPAGNYICAVTAARVEQARTTGADMLVVELDVADGEYRGFFTQQSKSFGNWPNGGTFRMMVSFNDKQTGKPMTNPVFKGFIEAVEKSNRGYSFTQAGADEHTLAYKRVGIRFREEEYEYQGQKRVKVAPWYAVPVDQVASFDIPKKKLLPKAETESAQQSATAAYAAAMTAANGSTQVDDGLPF